LKILEWKQWIYWKTRRKRRKANKTFTTLVYLAFFVVIRKSLRVGVVLMVVVLATVLG
jgi:hypothetical protein